MKNIDATKIWDMLRMSLFSDEKNSITFVYDSTEVTPNYQLMKARKMHSKETTWPEVEVVSYTDTEIRLRMNHEQSHTSTYIVRDDKPEEEALDNIDELVVSVGKHPYKVYVFNQEENLRGCLVFDFMSFTYQIHEHDEYKNVDYHFLIEDEDWEAACQNDAEAACRVAESIAAQSPDAVHIIRKYLNHAASLGCQKAQEQLQNL